MNKRYAFLPTTDSRPLVGPYSLVKKAQAYMPANYRAVKTDSGVLIIGKDNAGWTLDGYVLPRLASGGYHAHEVVAEEAVDLLLNTEGQTGLQAVTSEEKA